MREYLELARPYFALLALTATGRWLQGLFAVPYERGHHVFSIVLLTVFSCLYYGAFTRRFRGFRLMQAILLGTMFGVVSQLLILVLTVLSYALSMHTFFNHPTALNAQAPLSLVEALEIRLGGLVGNSIFSGITAALGWALGSFLPER